MEFWFRNPETSNQSLEGAYLEPTNQKLKSRKSPKPGKQMASYLRLYFQGLFVLAVLVSWASSSRISDAVFELHGSTGRSLLQTPTNCPVDFQNQNYTIITSRCRGPKFPADACCSAFKEFACPFVDEIDDLSTNCASTMFSYITIFGQYPPGLFAAECREGKQGLDCLNVTSYKSANSRIKNGSSKIFVASSPLALLFYCITSLFLFVSL